MRGNKSYAILDRKLLYGGTMTVTCSWHIITRWVDCRCGRNFVEGASDIPSSLIGQSLNGHISWLLTTTRKKISEFILFVIGMVRILKILKWSCLIFLDLVIISRIRVLISVTRCHASYLYISNSNEFLFFLSHFQFDADVRFLF